MTREEYEAKRQARYERLVNAAERASQESKRLTTQAHDMASIIPFGQPILVGHHSEGRDRNYRGKIENKFRKGYELSQKASELKSRAESMQNNDSIFSDDPDASEKIEAKIERLEKRQTIMKQANKFIIKNNKTGLLEMGFSETEIAKLFVPDCFGGIGFPSYKITNNGANIRRLKERLTTLAKVAEIPDSEEKIGSVTIDINTHLNRVQIFFPGKPEEKVRSELKSYGFHWSPSVGAWQRMISNGAIYHAREIVKKYYS